MRGVGKIVETVFAVLRVFSVWIVALFLPKLFIWYGQQTASVVTSNDTDQLKLGLENISENFFNMLNPGEKDIISVGLVTNQTGKDQAGKKTSDILAQKGFQVKKIFVPDCDSAMSIDTSANNSTENSNSRFCEQVSRLSDSALVRLTQTKKLTKQDMLGIDAIVFDVQDDSMHYDDYMAMLLETMEVAVSCDKKIVVLDRPNMLGGFMEGASSPIPTRHGMTVGELAHYYNKYMLPIPAQLWVVPMENYSRQFEAREMGSSTYTAHTESWYGHTLFGLLAQVKPFDLAYDTDQAFQCILLPDSLYVSKQKWDDLAVLLKKSGIESSFYRYCNKKNEQQYSGLHLFITAINDFSSYKMVLTIVKFFQDAGVALSFSDSFDKQFGTDKVRSFLQGDVSRDVLASEINGKVQQFFKKAFDCFIYKPLPKVVKL